MLYDKIKLESDEEVLLTARKHWFVIVAELLSVVAAAVTPFFLLGFFASQTGNLAAAGVTMEINSEVVTFGISAWLLLCVFAGFTIWTHYYLDLWIITDRRIISVDQVHFFNRNVAVFRLERLQDIEFGIKGLLATFLNFGTISAQTAGNHQHNFRASGMPDPRGLQSTIQKATDERLKELHVRPSQLE